MSSNLENNESQLEKEDTENVEDGQKMFKYHPVRNYEVIWQRNHFGAD